MKNNFELKLSSTCYNKNLPFSQKITLKTFQRWRKKEIQHYFLSKLLNQFLRHAEYHMTNISASETFSNIASKDRAITNIYYQLSLIFKSSFWCYKEKLSCVYFSRNITKSITLLINDFQSLSCDKWTFTLIHFYIDFVQKLNFFYEFFCCLLRFRFC